jgi:hypothetical protein
MWAGSDVCGLLAENVGLFAENVGLKYGPFAQNVSRTEGIFVGLRDYVCGLLQIPEILKTLNISKATLYRWLDLSAGNRAKP